MLKMQPSNHFTPFLIRRSFHILFRMDTHYLIQNYIDWKCDLLLNNNKFDLLFKIYSRFKIPFNNGNVCVFQIIRTTMILTKSIAQIKCFFLLMEKIENRPEVAGVGLNVSGWLSDTMVTTEIFETFP